MASNLDLARDFYAALTRADADRLRELLHPQFTGQVTDGTPAGLGATHPGPTAMLRHVGGPVDRLFAARPAPERFLSCESGEVVVTGSYTGQPPGAAEPLTAAFAHVLAFRNGRLAELRQFTDSHRRQQAAADAGLGTVRRMFEAAERRDPQALLGTYADDIVITEAASLPYGGVYHGHHGAVRHALAYTATWDHLQSAGDRRMEPLIWSAGDRVVALWRQKATAADGRHLDLPVVDVIELRNGKVGSLHMFPADTAKLLEFLRTGSPQAQPG
jgi:ketosteroid isomerase-like protein